VPGVAKVDLLGTQDERVFIEVSSAALAERGLTAQDIAAALAGQNAMDAAGRIETRERSVRIDVNGTLRSVEEIRELRLHAGQQTFRLGDIADVKRALEDPPPPRPLSGRGGAALNHYGARPQTGSALPSRA
jgi:multidrug efflux pump subunit AcrB